MSLSRPSDNSKALADFVRAKAEIDAALARLIAFSADHFGADPDTVTWGDVGTLNHHAAKLREITDMAFSEGSCAK